MFTCEKRELDFIPLIQGYAKYHRQRGTVEFHAFFIHTRNYKLINYKLL